MLWQGDHIAAGGNSGFQAINWAGRCGIKTIILTGYDFGIDGDRTHWHGDHPGCLTNPQDHFLKRCAAVLDTQHKNLEGQGIRVLNASRISRLKMYRRVSIDEALAAIS